ncbi:helix-turn-helix domain-containing protein [Vibrio sp. OPT18]|uniref:helix-turn-helix domain-containing protein n=1 Tax=Vibrio sp. OPT18 TaxID=2778641 RepID=UPI00187F94B5|nr:helix-turn-helix transcriptional regulator [Vibrio sp. OPT18]MBE8578682.1 helix-turn-helix domain-containing protein [Vibrio sp. OPT18]
MNAELTQFDNGKPDMHRADIVAALKKKKLSLRRLSVSNGLAPTTLGNVMSRPWPKGEKIVADALGVNPEEIWPSRYEVF